MNCGCRNILTRRTKHTISAAAHANRNMLFVPQSIVLYRENLQSATFRPKKKLMQNWIQIASDFEAFLKERRIEKDYGDLMLFHLVIGAMYLAKEEMTYEGENVSVVKKLLKQYGSDPFVRKTLTIRNCLHYGVQIKSVFWKLLSFTLVLFFTSSRIWFSVSHPRFHVRAWN